MFSHEEREDKVSIAIEVAVKVGLLALVIGITYLIAKPFIGIVVWGIIIAVALSPVINTLEKRFGSRKKIIIALTVTVIAALIIPTYMMSGSVLKSTQTLSKVVKEGNFTVPPPTENVKEWPLIGKKSYAFWDNASHNLETTLAPYNEEIKGLFKSLLSAIGSGLGTIFMFIGSMIIDKGEEWANLSALTVRSVVMGVLGVAVIQAFFALIGMVLMGIPLAIVWAVIIMFLTIIQVPALLVIAPMIAYVFSQGSGTTEIVFAIYMLLVGASDGVLKPMLMGRGVDIPMLVILIGAIGGMMLMGMIGLFIGAVIFALAYKLFGLWIAEVEEESEGVEA